MKMTFLTDEEERKFLDEHVGVDVMFTVYFDGSVKSAMHVVHTMVTADMGVYKVFYDNAGYGEIILRVSCTGYSELELTPHSKITVYEDGYGVVARDSVFYYKTDLI